MYIKITIVSQSMKHVENIVVGKRNEGSGRNVGIISLVLL